MAYQFLDAYGSVRSADSSFVSGVIQRPIINVGSIIGDVTVTVTPGSVSGVGLFNVNHVGNGSILAIVPGSVATAPSPASVSGVGLFNVNHTGNGSILTIIPGSVATAPSPASVSGVGLFNVNHTGNGSILVVVPGSVATAPSPASVSGVGLFNVNHVGNGSIATLPSPASVSGVGLFNVNHTGNGSVITVFSSPSIVGTYAEDAAHASAERGLFTLGVRNDAVASFVSADLDYTPRAVDSAGRTITKPFAAGEALVQGTGSTVNVAKASLLGLSGTGLRNYLTDILIANTGSVATLVSFTDADGSVIGKTIAPATGGSNIHLATPMRTGALNSQVEFTAATATSILHVTGFGYKAP